jgi:lysophospholipid acyltransferase (LPLAT)-like uncharacterized protein
VNDPDPARSDQHNTTYRQVTKSQRRLTPMRAFLYRAGLPIAIGLVKLFWSSYRFIGISGDERFDALLAKHSAAIPVFWHQHLMICVRYLLRKQARGFKPGFLISPSVDGEAPAMLARYLGGHVIRGSASYTGARALRDFYQAISKELISPLISPDGPHGPRYVCKTGALLLSQLSGKPVVPIGYAASRVFKFRTWDRFILPLPFARVAIAVGEPISVPRVIKPEQLEVLQREVEKQLKALHLHAARVLANQRAGSQPA